MEPSDIQREVELTLSSLDRLKKVKAPVDFADTLTSSMIFAEDQVRWINRAKIALAAMVAMAILNGVVMFKSRSNQRDQMLDSIAEQYHLTGDL